MISIILPYLNCLVYMRERTLEYLDMVEDYIKYNPNIQVIISDYGSKDGIKDLVKKRGVFDYVYVEPNEGQFFNISKCNNAAFRIAKHNIIFTNSIDWRYSYDFLMGIVDHFEKLGDVVLEAPIGIIDKNGGLQKHVHIPVFLKKHLIMAGGWDERIFNWGQDDRDVMQSLIYHYGVYKYGFTHINFCIFHLWHEPIFYNKHGGKEQNTRNLNILKDNVMNGRKNIINSYWRVKKK